MTTVVEEPSAEELHARRARLLDRARMTRDEMAQRAEAGTLTAEEFWLYEDIRSVEFLLGADA